MSTRPNLQHSAQLPPSAKAPSGWRKGKAPAARTIAGDAPAIAFRNVSFSYRTMTVLDEASFVLNCGSLMALTGENGAGKSTLVQLLLGELTAERGSVELFGRDVRQFGDWNLLGYVPQQAPADYRQFPATVLEVVRAGLYATTGLFRPYQPLHRQLALAALDRAGLSGLESRLLNELSGGQFQRVLLARALANDPRLLVLDEPTSNLDAQSAQDFYGTLEAVQQTSDAAVLLVTHDLARLPIPIEKTMSLEGGKVRPSVDIALER